MGNVLVDAGDATSSTTVDEPLKSLPATEDGMAAVKLKSDVVPDMEETVAS